MRKETDKQYEEGIDTEINEQHTQENTKTDRKRMKLKRRVGDGISKRRSLSYQSRIRTYDLA